MTNEDRKTALEVAKRVNWYTPPDEVVSNTPLFISQVMARGGVRDIVWMLRKFPVEQQRDAYIKAPPGLFPRKCWAYWGLMLFGSPDAKPYPVRFPDIPESKTIRWPGF
ncbi:MAG: hypothetical protein OXF42_04480 [Candidatus Dadabacteria bacterium]|nr:hypothetical protein [Candidatus Dadabacteria bacterium]